MVKQNVSAIAVPRSSYAVRDPPDDRRDGDAAHAYADQTERDHAALLEAIQLGVLPAVGQR